MAHSQLRQCQSREGVERGRLCRDVQSLQLCLGDIYMKREASNAATPFPLNSPHHVAINARIYGWQLATTTIATTATTRHSTGSSTDKGQQQQQQQQRQQQQQQWRMLTPSCVVSNFKCLGSGARRTEAATTAATREQLC